MYFLILLPKPLIHVHVSNHTSKKMIAKYMLGQFHGNVCKNVHSPKNFNLYKIIQALCEIHQYRASRVREIFVNFAKLYYDSSKVISCKFVFLIYKLILKEKNMCMPMKELTSSMAGVCDELKSTNKNKTESLKIFIKCKDMVCWVQDNIKSKY